MMDYPLAHKDKDGWYSDGDYEQRGGKMTTMTPHEYLKSVRPLTIDDASRDNIDDLKHHIQSGRKLDPLKIYHDGREDGRHRAHAAAELGIKQVPVIKFEKPLKENFQDDEIVANKAGFLAQYGTDAHKRKMADHPHHKARAAAAAYSKDKAVHDKLVSDPHEDVRREIPQHGHPEHLDRLVNDHHFSVRMKVAEYGTTKHHDALVNDEDGRVRGMVAQSGSHDHRAKLIGDENDYVRRQVARHGTDDMVRKLAHDHEPMVKITSRNIAARRGIDIHESVIAERFTPDSKQFAHAMVHDKDHEIRAKAAVHGTKEQLDHLVNDHHPAVRGEVAVRGHADHLDKLVHDKDASVRQIVAIRGQKHHIDQLVHDSDPVVRQLAQKHPSQRMNESVSLLARIRAQLKETV